ncbi:MAG: UPF0164 family protein [Acidobacteria bacterium]|nr:UPF0164 family protein [Acidobacteriota bacterium]
MRPPPSRLALHLLVLVLGNPPLAAQTPIGTIISEQSRTTFTVQGAGARAMGLGGAFIAVADDASAVSFNPAGLAQLLRPELSFVGRAISRRVGFEDVALISGTKQVVTGDSLISNRRFDPLLLAGTVPLRVAERTLALQLSLQRMLPLTEGDSRDLTENPVSGGPSNRLHQSIVQKGQIDLYTLAIAYELSQRVLAGFAYNVWRGNWDLDSRSSKASGPNLSHVNFTQSSHLEGSNLRFGLIWRWPTWSLGLVHRTAFHADYSFSTTLDATGSTPQVTPTADTGLHWPATQGIGFAYRPREHWLFTADLTHTSWSKARYMTPNRALNGLSFFDLDKGNRTADATNFHLGGEHLFVTSTGSVIPFRFGYSREPQPVVDRLTNQQRILQGLSGGTGWKQGPYTVDLSYRYAWSNRQASQYLDVDQILSKTPPTSTGHERLQEHRLDLSLILQFDRGPVERLLRHLFVGD